MAEMSEPGRGRRSISEPPDLRLVLVGKTGAGKSSSGNNILGREAFSAAVSHSSVTRCCCKQSSEVFGRRLTIIDTPGLFDTSQPDDTVQREISKCVNMSAPGPHAILLVIKVGCFTAEERAAVRQVENIFGEDAWKYTIILFTQDEPAGADIQKQLDEAGPELRSTLSRAGNRYHVLNNSRMSDRGQVLELLEKVEMMVSDNGGEFYSNYTYQQVVQMLTQREVELRDFYRDKLKEQLIVVESKYEKKLQEAAEERRDVEQRLQAELQEVRRYYRALERAVRHVVEQTVSTDSMEDIFKFCQTLRLKFTS